MTTFSERFGFAPSDVEITTHDAPEELRVSLVDIAYEAGLTPRSLHVLVCKTLFIAPDTNNWSEYPNIDSEVRRLLEDALWHEVYDIIEAIAAVLPPTMQFMPEHPGAAPRQGGYAVFEDRLNRLFRKRGIGWQLTDKQIAYRGTEAVAMALRGRTGARHRARDGRLGTASGYRRPGTPPGRGHHRRHSTCHGGSGVRGTGSRGLLRNPGPTGST